MEMNEDGFLEELLALRRKEWETTTTTTNNPSSTDEINGLFSTTTWASSFDGLDSSFDSFSSTLDNNQPPPPPLTTTTATTLDHHHCSSFTTPDFYTGPFEPGSSGPFDPGFSGPNPDDYVIDNSNSNNNNNNNASCKAEHSTMSSAVGVGVNELEMENNPPSSSSLSPIIAGSFDMGKRVVSNKMIKVNNKNNNNNNKIEGQPSKNLMAERRRRKRLNDRLSMLRSVVPKISKMDRTSILGDTIDYMKELLEKINNLQEDNNDVVGSKNPLNIMTNFKDNIKPNDALVRNSPKFDVERRNLDTKLEICCAGKSGLLLSTVATLEAMGLDIQQCVISCFNDFSLQASCYEEMEQKSVINSEDIKQALFRNAGYGGRCL